VDLLKAINLGAKFVVELAAFAALAWWGGTVGHGVMSVLIGIAAPLLAVVLWGLWAAPRAKRRLPLARRVPFELGVFAVAAVAIGTVSVPAGIVLAAAAAVNAALLTAFAQWDN
jgi:hypothetical protein